jgi:hypothetical protein
MIPSFLQSMQAIAGTQTVSSDGLLHQKDPECANQYSARLAERKSYIRADRAHYPGSLDSSLMESRSTILLILALRLLERPLLGKDEL